MTDFHILVQRQGELMQQITLQLRDIEMARKMLTAQDAVIYAATIQKELWQDNQRLAHDKMDNLQHQLRLVNEQLANVEKPDV